MAAPMASVTMTTVDKEEGPRRPYTSRSEGGREARSTPEVAGGLFWKFNIARLLIPMVWSQNLEIMPAVQNAPIMQRYSKRHIYKFGNLGRNRVDGVRCKKVRWHHDSDSTKEPPALLTALSSVQSALTKFFRGHLLADEHRVLNTHNTYTSTKVAFFASFAAKVPNHKKT